MSLPPSNLTIVLSLIVLLIFITLSTHIILILLYLHFHYKLNAQSFMSSFLLVLDPYQLTTSSGKPLRYTTSYDSQLLHNKKALQAALNQIVNDVSFVSSNTCPDQTSSKSQQNHHGQPEHHKRYLQFQSGC